MIQSNSYKTSTGIDMDGELISRYIRSLVDRFFKILPIKEGVETYGPESLDTYLRSLQAELIGHKALVVAIQHDPAFMTLLNILQYLIDHPECTVKTVKREVFHAISICNKLKSQYAVRESG